MFAFSYLLSALTAFYDVYSNSMSNLDKIIIRVFSPVILQKIDESCAIFSEEGERTCIMSPQNLLANANTSQQQYFHTQHSGNSGCIFKQTQSKSWSVVIKLGHEC